MKPAAHLEQLAMGYLSDEADERQKGDERAADNYRIKQLVIEVLRDLQSLSDEEEKRDERSPR